MSDLGEALLGLVIWPLCIAIAFIIYVLSRGRIKL